MKLIVQFDLTDADLVAFEAYEAAVLPLLAEHGGVLEQRLRAVDDASETHMIRFPTRADFEAYVADPRRLIQADTYTASRARTAHWEVRDV